MAILHIEYWIVRSYKPVTYLRETIWVISKPEQLFYTTNLNYFWARFSWPLKVRNNANTVVYFIELYSRSKTSVHIGKLIKHYHTVTLSCTVLWFTKFYLSLKYLDLKFYPELSHVSEVIILCLSVVSECER